MRQHLDEEKIKDMRGGRYSANYLTVVNGKLYWAGYVVKIEKGQNPESVFPSHCYYSICVPPSGFVIGGIALTDEDAQKALSIQLSNTRK